MKRLHLLACLASLWVSGLFSQALAAPPYLNRTPANKLVSSDLAAGDWFGAAVAVRGEFALVGAYQDDDGGSGAGSAYLFDLGSGIQLRKLVASDPGAAEFFGYAVGLTEHYAVVGAYQDSTGPIIAGAVYVFDLATGAQVHKLTASDAEDADSFGRFLAVSGDYLVVGAYGDDDGGNNAGAAYVLRLSTGEELFKLRASDASVNDRFGGAVAVHGQIAMVGAYNAGDGVTDAGAAYLFDLSTGEEIRKFSPPVPKHNLQFGASVGLSETLVVVGSPDDDLDAGSGLQYGAVHVYDLATGSLLRSMGHTGANLNDSLGGEVALSGDLVLSPSTAIDSSKGAAFFFNAARFEEELYRIDPSDGVAGILFGFSAALDGELAVVGAPNNAAGGAAYVFDFVRAQADVRVGTSLSSTTGDGVYNDTAAGQTAPLTSRSARAVTGYFNIENDGELADFIACRATPGNSLFTANYFRHRAGERSNITAMITIARYAEANLAPVGDRRVIEVVIDPADSLISTKRIKKPSGKVVKKTSVRRATFTARLDVRHDERPENDSAAITVTTR